MRRTAKPRPAPSVKPVEKVTVSTRYMGLRIAAVIVLVIVGAASLAYGFTSLFTGETGWTEIAANSAKGPSLAGNFVLLYDVQNSGEKRAVTALYTEAAEKAWQLFNNDQATEGVPNIRYLNDHPNEAVTVDEGLYKALAEIVESGSRHVYLAAVARTYDNLFFCADDALTADFDPLLNDDLRRSFGEIAAFARDKSAVRVEMLPDHQVCLKVSDAYLAYAEAEEINDFIDLHWMLNAFAADYIADRLMAQGYTRGALSSADGFARTLGAASAETYSVNVYDGRSGAAVQAAVAQYPGAGSVVTLHSYPLSGESGERYYVRRDGQVRNRFLDVQDGLSRAALPDLMLHSAGLGCGETLLRAIPFYIADTFDEAAALAAWGEAGIGAVWCRDHAVRYTDPKLTLYLAEGYTAELAAD